MSLDVNQLRRRIFDDSHEGRGKGREEGVDRPFLRPSIDLFHSRVNINTRTRAHAYTELLNSLRFSRLHSRKHGRRRGGFRAPERISARSLSLLTLCRREKLSPSDFFFRHARVSTNDRGSTKRTHTRMNVDSSIARFREDSRRVKILEKLSSPEIRRMTTTSGKTETLVASRADSSF